MLIQKKDSCASILLDFFKESNVKFDSELSTRILLGVCTDSGFFINENSEDAMKSASFLIENGAKYVEFILKEVYFKEPLRMKKYSAYVIDNLIIDEKKRFAYSLLPNEKIKELNLNKAEIRAGISYVSGIEGLDLVFTLSDLGNNNQKLSLRSITTDVSKIAEKFGGGGHKAAAASVIKDCTLEEAKDKVIRAIEEEFSKQ